jgi:hypothetical protein
LKRELSEFCSDGETQLLFGEKKVHPTGPSFGHLGIALFFLSGIAASGF